MSDGATFRALLAELAGRTGTPASSEVDSERLMRAFLDFGSETPDNLNCAAHIEYGEAHPDSWRPEAIYHGLKVKDKNILVSDVVHLLEDLRLPRAVKREFPDLTSREWDAVMRMATMVLLAFERRLTDAQGAVDHSPGTAPERS